MHLTVLTVQNAVIDGIHLYTTYYKVIVMLAYLFIMLSGTDSVRLVELSRENEAAVLRLRGTLDQSVNALGMTQVLAWRNHYFYWCRVIAVRDQVVGIVVINTEIDDERAPFLHLILIDKEHQRKCYGKAAMGLVLDLFGKCFKHMSLVTSESNGAAGFYEKLGFTKSDLVHEEGKVFLRVNFDNKRIDADLEIDNCLDTKVSFRKVDQSNLQDIMELAVKEDQPVQPLSVARELFRAGFYPYWQRAIYYDSRPLGLVIVNMEVEDGDVPFLNLFMIDRNFQGLGTGKIALGHLISILRRFCKQLNLCTHPTHGPIDFYRKLGFVETGQFFGEKAVLSKPL